MEKHERHCTMNPERTCRWHLLDDMPSTRMVSLGHPQTHQLRRGLPRWLRMSTPVTDEVIVRLREHALGCPACMLAAIRQSGIDRMTGFDYRCRWDYGEEVDRYRKDEREHWISEEHRDAMAGLY